jgi:uncharacterized protein (DUF885 family)
MTRPFRLGRAAARLTPFLAAVALVRPPAGAAAQMASPLSPAVPSSVVRPTDPMTSIPRLTSRIGETHSELAEVVDQFTADQSSLTRRYDAVDSPAQRRRMREFHSGWRTRLKEINFDKLGQEGRVDYVLLDNYLRHQVDVLDRRDKLRAETAPLLPFADRILALQDARRDLVPVEPAAWARTVAKLAHDVDSIRTLFEPPASGPGGRGGAAAAPASTDSARPRGVAPRVNKTVGNRGAQEVDQLRTLVGTWYRYYDGYDPLFSWWVKDPYQKLDVALNRYARTLRERVVGYRQTEAAPSTTIAANAGGRGGAGGGRGGGGGGNVEDPNGPIIGVPIGAEGLKADLAFEMIPYTPEELIAIAEKEYAFSLSEMKKASRDMGFGDDWKAAMEKVKNTYVEPGKQPDLIRDLAAQAEAFFDKHDWVTIPALAREDWRMEMMTPARQRVAPFFLGGDLIQVSYPTDEMTDDEKLMSMRGNNPYFSHATVFHELNPGHHLQGFMSARYNQHRRLFTTPFWNEGQSLYWEMFLWDHGFQDSPENRVGALFWRMHRSARIIFSLSFHLGKMTPEQAIQFLVDTVNFERANAEGEVRRSFNGSYSPLYQAGYMLGGLELRSLHQELVDSKKMTDREFHDAVLKGGPMPIAMVRARLENIPLTRDGSPPWRFDQHLPPPIPSPSQKSTLK